MQYAELTLNKHIRNSNEFNQCTILWRNLPALFKTRWRCEAERLSMSGYSLFIKTNISNLKAGDDLKISPWH